MEGTVKCRSRKRQRDPSAWKQNRENQLRYSAKSLPKYPSCNHRGKKKCRLMKMKDVMDFHSAFYASPTKATQNAFILKYCRASLPKRLRSRNSTRSQKNITIEYSIINHVGNHLPICRETFLSVLGITKHRVEESLQDSKETDLKFLLKQEVETEDLKLSKENLAKFCLAPTQIQYENSLNKGEDKIQRLAVHSEQYIAKGTRFLPFQGIVQLGRYPMEPFLSEHNVLLKYGSFDLIQEFDNRRIRQCNWVRFLLGSDLNPEIRSITSGPSTPSNNSDSFELEPNMTAMFLDGQPVFEVTKCILPHTLIVVQLNEKLVSSPSTDFLSSLKNATKTKNYSITNIVTSQESPLDLSKSLLRSSRTQSDTGTSNRVRLSHRSLLPCEVCGKVFDRPSLLKRHMRTHTGEKPHVCEVCNKGFSTSSSLNTHRRIHSGDKPHQCLVCGKRFTASSNLYYHRMTHTKEKPHKCGQCSKSFPTPGDLKAHMYIHSGSWPFRCNVCSRGFSKQTNLRNHLILHTGDRPYPCEFCGKKFALACNLRAHIKTHHHNKEKPSVNKEASSDQKESNILPEFKNQIKCVSSVNDCKNYNTWYENSNKEVQATVTSSGKCSLQQSQLTEQSPYCHFVKSFFSLENTQVALHPFTCADRNKPFEVNSRNYDPDKSATNSDQFHGICKFGYSNILEEMWPENNSFINQCNIPFSVVQAPFSINMPCLTSISLGDLQALLLMQAANMTMLQGGNVAYNDGKLFKNQMTEPAQSRSILLV